MLPDGNRREEEETLGTGNRPIKRGRPGEEAQSMNMILTL